MSEFDNYTKCQIVQIQAIDIVKFLVNAIDIRDVTCETTNKIQKMFNLVHNNPLDYGIKEDKSN